MSIWNKVLLGLIFVAAAVFVYLGARTLKTHQYWRELAEKHETRIEALVGKPGEEEQGENYVLLAGKEKEGEVVEQGIRQLKIELEKLLLDRGRVWTECTPQIANAQTGQARVTPGAPNPHGIAANTVLFVFEEKEVENQGRYLGQFKATQVAEEQVLLEPAQQMTPEQLARIAASQGFWVLHDVMPIDNHYIFAGLSEDEKRAMLPAGSVEEFLRDGQPATWEDLKAWGVGGFVVEENGVPLVDDQGQPIAGAKGIYQRSLRDYRSLMDIYHKERTVLVDLRESAERDLAYMTAALDDANKQVAFRQQEVAALKADLAKYRAERDAVLAHEKAVGEKLGELNRGIDLLLADNRAKASQIAQIQYEATRQIDARTRAMAQAPEGEN